MLKVILLWQLINCTEINHTCNRLRSNHSGTTYLMLFNSVPHSEDWFKPWLKLFLFKSQSIFWSWSFSSRLQIAFKNLLIIMNSIGYERVFVIDSISTERHRAEVRRAYSDDRLAIVAERYILLIPDICWKILKWCFFRPFTCCWFHSCDSKRVVTKMATICRISVANSTKGLSSRQVLSMWWILIVPC